MRRRRSSCSGSSARGTRRVPVDPLPRRARDRVGPASRGEPDLGARPRAGLGEWASRSTARDFFFVEGYPMAKRPFYTHPDPERPEVVEQLRPAVPRSRAVTGGQRLHRPSDYAAAMQRTGTDPRRSPATSTPSPRHASPRRLRHRPREVGRPPDRSRERPRGDAVPARPAPTRAMSEDPRCRRHGSRRQAAACLVASRRFVLSIASPPVTTAPSVASCTCVQFRRRGSRRRAGAPSRSG